MSTDQIILFLLGVLQVIALGAVGWLCLRTVEVLERLNKMEGKFDAFPIQQISNNRHRIENLERHQEGYDIRLTGIERAIEALRNFCNQRHQNNL